MWLFIWQITIVLSVHTPILITWSGLEGNKVVTMSNESLHRAFSPTWPAALPGNWNKRKCLHEKRVQLPQDWCASATWLPFLCFGTPIWLPWHHRKTLYQPSRSKENQLLSRLTPFSRARHQVHFFPLVLIGSLRYLHFLWLANGDGFCFDLKFQLLVNQCDSLKLWLSKGSHYFSK